MKERLFKARNYLGLEKQEFADKIGVKLHNIRDMESGKQKISSEFATKVEEIFSIRGWWLLTGKGEMLSNEKVIDTTNDTIHKDDNLVYLEYYENIAASAGAGAYNHDESYTLMAFDRNFLKVQLGLSSYNHIHIITATGDSMEPTIVPGEYLFVSPIENEGSVIKEGSIYIIQCGDAIQVKRLAKDNIKKTITLVSDNTIYPPTTITHEEFENCNILGRVIGHFSGL